MSELFESIKQGAGQVLSEIDQKGQLRSAIDGIRSQWSELERRRKKSTMESQVKSMRSEMRQLAEALGLQTLSLYESGTIKHPELARLCERLSELREDIDHIKQELDALEQEAKPAPVKANCPLCQEVIDANADFCPKCGAQLTKPAAEEAPPPAQPKKRTIVRTRCPRCKTEVPSDAAFCPTCGAKFKRTEEAQTAAKPFCPSCGAETKPDARFCPICGHTIRT